MEVWGMRANGLSEFSALPGEIVSDDDLDRIIGGKDNYGSNGGRCMSKKCYGRSKKRNSKKKDESRSKS
jgi:hypothetical protein